MVLWEDWAVLRRNMPLIERSLGVLRWRDAVLPPHVPQECPLSRSSALGDGVVARV